MPRIFKYSLLAEPGPQQVSMPEDPLILSVGAQGEQLVLWAIVDDARPSRPYLVDVYWTGDGIGDPEARDFIGTVQVGALVYHVFAGDPEAEDG